jgi:hypothetical protein
MVRAGFFFVAARNETHRRCRRTARRRGSTQRGLEATASCSPAEELLLVHLLQTAARGRRWNAGNGCTLRSSAYSGELKPAGN